MNTFLVDCVFGFFCRSLTSCRPIKLEVASLVAMILLQHTKRIFLFQNRATAEAGLARPRDSDREWRTIFVLRRARDSQSIQNPSCSTATQQETK
jgi:hypothetical protein